MMIKVATPVSHFFENSKCANEIIKYSDCLECRDKTISFSKPKQELFHCHLQPIHYFTEKEFDYLKKVKKTKPGLKLITFHCALSCDKPYLRNGIYEVGGREYSEGQMKKNAEKNFIIIKEIFGDDIKIAIENNNYYPTRAYNFVTEPGFISSIVYNNDIEFLFDLAHAKITSHNKKISYEEYKNKLPLGRIIQLHICRYGINKKKLAYDAHNYPQQKEFDEVRDLTNKFNIKYVTIEYYKDIEKLVGFLKRLRKLI